jgi:hypothetical protein
MVPSVGTVKSGAVFAKDCVVGCNAPERFRGAVITSVSVLGVMLLMSGMSKWSARAARAAEAPVAAPVAAGSATVGRPRRRPVFAGDGGGGGGDDDDDDTLRLARSADPILRAAIREYDQAAGVADANHRRDRAQQAIGMVRAAEMLAPPALLADHVGCDTGKLKRSLGGL